MYLASFFDLLLGGRSVYELPISKFYRDFAYKIFVKRGKFEYLILNKSHTSASVHIPVSQSVSLIL